jgi:hypothetical protein
VQEPGPITVMVDPVVPDDVHTDDGPAAKDTPSPEVAVADTMNGAAPNVTFASGPKLMVWVTAGSV